MGFTAATYIELEDEVCNYYSDGEFSFAIATILLYGGTHLQNHLVY